MKTSVIQKQLRDCCELLSAVFGKDVLGVYLYGSYLVGGLQQYSDIDILVVTNRSITAEEKAGLIQNLLTISGIYMKDTKPPIEITIVTKAAVNPWQYPPLFEFQYGEWLRQFFERGNATPWQNQEMPDLALIITQVLLKSHTLAGKKPEQLLVPVPYHDFMNAMLTDLDRLADDIEDDTRNVLLTLARIWSTIETNTIRSKPEAADWALDRLPLKHQTVLERAKLICTGKKEEYWEDLSNAIKPCADVMRSHINQKKLSINPKDPSNKIMLA